MTYGNLELEIDGPLAKDLLNQVQDEASQSDVRLTSAHNANVDNPSNCTPRMAAWAPVMRSLTGRTGSPK